jgi:hypothetical protein
VQRMRAKQEEARRKREEAAMVREMPCRPKG